MTPATAQQTSGTDSYPSAAVAWYSTVLLALLYWLSLLDRSVISLMVDPIKADLGISDVQFGMLHGMAFAVTFSVFGLAAGILADRRSRRVVIVVSVLVWSAATAACGFARSFAHLMLARVGVGAGEAGLNPCATSMITDFFPPQRRTLPLAVYGMGASVGTGFAFLAGGMLIDMTRGAGTIDLPLIGVLSAWQAVFLIIGLPGLLIALLGFTMPEPQRHGLRDAAVLNSGVVGGYAELFRFMRVRKGFFAAHYVGFGLASTCFAGASAWYPALMGREFGWSGSEIGLGMGGATILGGLIGKLLSGFCVDALYRRGHDDAPFVWFAGNLLFATPVGVFALTSANPQVFLVGVGLAMMLVSPLTALYLSALNRVTPNELRGSGVAFFSATMGLVALSSGPVMIAMFAQYLFDGAIGPGLASTFVLCYPLAALALLRGRPAMREAVAAARAWDADTIR